MIILLTEDSYYLMTFQRDVMIDDKNISFPTFRLEPIEFESSGGQIFIILVH